MSQIPIETLKEALSYFPVDVPDTGYLLVKADQYTILRQATLSLVNIIEERSSGKNT